MISQCTNCNSTMFELVECAPNGSSYKMFFVQCSSCGGVVSSMEYYASFAKIEELEKKVNILQTTVDGRLMNIENALNEVGRRLR